MEHSFQRTFAPGRKVPVTLVEARYSELYC